MRSRNEFFGLGLDQQLLLLDFFGDHFSFDDYFLVLFFLDQLFFIGFLELLAFLLVLVDDFIVVLDVLFDLVDVELDLGHQVNFNLFLLGIDDVVLVP